MKSIELCTGAGGLAMGCAKAGFHHLALVELSKHSCHTIRENQRLGIALLDDWHIHNMDVTDFDYSTISEEIDLLAGGPPCQPFSIGGRHGAFLDKRDMFPQFFRAVRALRPKAFLIENVRGLLRRNFQKFFEYIILQLTHPEAQPKPDEFWADHLARLERHHNSGKSDDLEYHVTFRLLNAADYGVPQKRERVFIVGFRSDLKANWSFPEPTHTNQALIWHKWITGEYWERHSISSKERPQMSAKLRSRLQRTGANLLGSMSAPWCTVRDAIADLPPPENTDMASHIPNHIYIPGARSYPGHTGSPLDEPAKTLKAGVHGVPGGENMLALPDGQVRYFTVREAARLQTFPDDYYFPCAWGESMRQIGNAVPVTLAYLIASSIRSHLRKVCHGDTLRGELYKN
ncbi:DNA (cytosine-5-)-methyltransferase (plasmid) [Brasilonema octagenarum UFV-E1]|uniref:DNA (cytosine-5-)-methyltransferase n=2 Tax=Brasilonema TaxID=383614 RepID=A0A856MQQ3_9CYAN|nr:DNA cytosine methyltransferase [Brasilonema sennae]NMF62503.1 DNA (cytosine-5-)-methyltransferase [Brasilonema octagenarum UFV-OR1]QDL12862.1 DNA (cytosine-5-)-methyltransferase [Brasilonema sennae CENA114]QDL19259.1 DNA (cytosine-5-)-methyltransferase [Brasilonema octagenarum UFV-E1]